MPVTATYTATLTTSADADAVEDVLDELPGSAMLGADSDGLVDVVFPIAAESPVLALLAASGAVARVGRVLGDGKLALAVEA